MDKMKVLLVEDKTSDARLVEEAFAANGIKCDMIVLHDGEEAIRFLSNENESEKGLMTDIIILDIKLPKKSGHEVLKDIKSSNLLKDIPVIMLTNSDTKEDIIESYEHQANCYIIKPFHMSEFVEVVKYINDIWLKKKGK
jgi:chemotaxis family two-component system response regulator Rcp1